ncbi:MAG: ATP-binding protein [Actinomycetota bacterium]|nr:ATP-binding protein [Actinomycetota bacterium]
MQQRNTERFILIIPASSRFLPLVRQAMQTLVHEADVKNEAVYDLQLAVMEACNLVAHAYTGQDAVKAISVSALFENGTAHVTIDDGAGSHAGRKVREKIGSRQLPFEGNLALKTTKHLCDAVALSSGITGGLRIELSKHF